MKKSVVLALVVGSGIFSGAALAATDGSLILPNTFTAGTPAQASEVNANFSAVKSAVDDHNFRLTAAEQTIVSHTNSLTTNNSAHSFLATEIASKQARVTGSCPSGNSIQVINVDGTVACQANSAGTITGVTAGTGLSSDVTSGNVTLYIPNEGITSSHLANGSVGTLAIAPGAVASGNLAPGAVVAAKIDAGAVGSAAIADGSVTAVKIADEPGVEFSSASSWNVGLSTCGTLTNLDSVTVTAPSSGFIYVSASGGVCTYTGNVTSWLGMDNLPAGNYPGADGGNALYDSSSVNRGCGSIAPSAYAFQYVYPVAAGDHTYYLHGCVTSPGATTQLNRHPMVAMFFPTRY